MIQALKNEVQRKFRPTYRARRMSPAEVEIQAYIITSRVKKEYGCPALSNPVSWDRTIDLILSDVPELLWE